jgi:hypothetical protein
VESCLLIAADVGAESVAVLASCGGSTRSLLPPTSGGPWPRGWAPCLRRALLDGGAAAAAGAATTTTGGAGGAHDGTAPLEVSRALRHAMLALRRSGVVIARARRSSDGGSAETETQQQEHYLDIHGNTVRPRSTRGGGGGGGHGGCERPRGRRRVVVMAAGPW